MEGTTRWPQAEHEPDRGGNAANYPVGDKARRLDAVAATRADPGRDVGTKGILNSFPRWQTVSGPGMTRTSFVAASKAYLTAMRPYYRPSTLEWWRRNFTTIRADLEALIEDGSIKRTTPSQIGDKDIEALLLRWRERLDVSTQEKYLMTLAGLLEWCGNPVVSIMRKRKHVRFPHGPAKPIRVLGPDELARIRAAIEALDGWSGSVARFLVGFLPCTGLRPKEFRLAGLKDIDLTKGRILVAHPKGEQAWASADFAPIPPMARPVLEDFLAERADYLEGRECEWLVPYVRMSGEIGPWSDAMLRKLKGQLSRGSGVAFSLKTFRATFAQIAKDRGVSIEKVSRALRHMSTDTTEAFYARIRADDAFRDIDRAFDLPEIRVKEPA